jgi:hypothetical protein
MFVWSVPLESLHGETLQQSIYIHLPVRKMGILHFSPQEVVSVIMRLVLDKVKGTFSTHLQRIHTAFPQRKWNATALSLLLSGLTTSL